MSNLKPNKNISSKKTQGIGKIWKQTTNFDQIMGMLHCNGFNTAENLNLNWNITKNSKLRKLLEKTQNTRHHSFAIFQRTPCNFFLKKILTTQGNKNLGLRPNKASWSTCYCFLELIFYHKETFKAKWPSAYPYGATMVCSILNLRPFKRPIVLMHCRIFMTQDILSGSEFIASSFEKSSVLI